MTHHAVRAWQETITIPTYPVGKPDKNPMFLEKRVYQGSSGAVYPYPVIDSVADAKEDRQYTALFLEHRYLKIMILPELGGRVQMALDKTNDYHFVYYNRVVKPALVGLAGPWISGGIEFNWPQHHRPTTFMPVDWRIEAHADGSQTIWCSEVEPMFGTKGMHGFRLYPDRAYLEIDVRLSNRTSEPQTFLWWANPAVHVNDSYQSVFPPDVHAVMDHGKRDVSTFPIATGTYYKVNYAPGTDISRYKHIPVPTSYMAHHSDFDFLGCYDHDKQAGMLHIANHHLVPGKKQWTWGAGEFGRAWDRQLTDADGPYIELMCGAFTDNQPDFSWLMPGEEKRFTQVFMPYKLIGPPQNASHEAAISLVLDNSHAQIGVYLTRPRTVQVRLRRGAQLLFEQTATLSPEHVLQQAVAIPTNFVPHELTLEVYDGTQLVVAFSPLADTQPELPKPALPAPPPAEIQTNEELFLHGLHLEQYRHATYQPEAYYEEALRRDPHDARCNNAIGLLLYRRGVFAEAEAYFRRAIARLTLRNPNPYDGEVYYNLGLALLMQERLDEATTAFYKATWNAAWQAAAFFELARLSTRRGNLTEALQLCERTLRCNWSHHRARHLKIVLLRRLLRLEEALHETEIALDLDPLEYGALWERSLLDIDATYQLGASSQHTLLVLLSDYGWAGMIEDARNLAQRMVPPTPMAHYLAGWYASCAGDQASAEAEFRAAAALPPDWCFPHRLESVPALESALRYNPHDARAAHYLGNFWYAHRRATEAISCWERASALDPSFATTQRNLGLAYVNKHGDLARGHHAYTQAFALNPTDARVLFELDQLDKRMNMPPAERLAHLEQHATLVAQRDDLSIEYISLLNRLGQYAQALAQLQARRFHPWEGGEGKVIGQYVLSLAQQARSLLAKGQYAQAISLLEQAQHYPENLGEGKLPGAQENHIFYWLGCAYQGLGDQKQAAAMFTRASTGLSEPTSAVYYNDQPPDMIFYQGLAQRKLGHPAAAQAIFQRLIEYGTTHMNDTVQIDYFAVSLPDFLVFDADLVQQNRIHCHYMIALGNLGLGEHIQAAEHFAHILALNTYHLGAVVHREFSED